MGQSYRTQWRNARRNLVAYTKLASTTNDRIGQESPNRGFVSSQAPTYGATVVRLEDYRPDAKFVARVQELLAKRTLEEAWQDTGIHPNQLRDILKGKTTQPTFNMLRRLARLQPWATPTWVATGH